MLDNQKHKVLKPKPSPSYYLNPNSQSWFSHLPEQETLQIPKWGFCTFYSPRVIMLKGTKRRPIIWTIQSKFGNNKAEYLTMAD